MEESGKIWDKEERERKRKETKGVKQEEMRKRERERERAVSGPQGESDWVVSRGDRWPWWSSIRSSTEKVFTWIFFLESKTLFFSSCFSLSYKHKKAWRASEREDSRALLRTTPYRITRKLGRGKENVRERERELERRTSEGHNNLWHFLAATSTPMFFPRILRPIIIIIEPFLSLHSSSKRERESERVRESDQLFRRWPF